jgi:hypothetical protein
LEYKREKMDKETRELLSKLFTSQLQQLAEEKEIDCGEDPDRIDYLSILGKSDQITKEDVERFIGEAEDETKPEDESEEYFGEVERVLKDYKSQGQIFEKVESLLKEIQQGFEEGNLEGTISKGVEGSGLIEETAVQFEKVRRAYVIYAFRQLIGDVRDCGIDIGEVEQMANQAASHLFKDEKEELDEVLEKIANRAESLTVEQAKKMKELITSVEEFIDETRDLGANIKEAKEFFQQAQEAFDSNTFKKMSYYSTKARKAAEDARKDRIQSISDSLIFVRSILNDARDIGADVIEAEKIYSKAESAYSEKALKLRKRRETEEEPKKDVVEVEPEAAPQAQKRFMRAYSPPYPQSYPPRPPGRTRPPSTQDLRKTRCPNCGQSFPTPGGDGPKRVECPFCGMRGLMP